jgi:hypothetical protein
MLIDRFFSVSAWIMPIYVTLYILFCPPCSSARRCGWRGGGNAEEQRFFVVIYQAMNCGMHIWFEHLLSILTFREHERSVAR